MTGRLPDLDVVRGFLRESWDAGAALERLGMKHVRASADGDLRVLYEVPGRDGAVLRLSARRVSPEEGRRAQGPALYAPDLGLLFHVFPADRRLPALAVATDARAMRPVLEAALARVRDGATLAAVRIEVLRYKPERKCLLRYELAWDGAPASEIAYARVARWPRFQRNRDALRRIHEAAEGLAFALPEPLGVVPDLGMELFAHVPGVRLFTLVETAAFPRKRRRVSAIEDSTPSTTAPRLETAATIALFSSAPRSSEFVRNWWYQWSVKPESGNVGTAESLKEKISRMTIGA